MAWEPVIGRQLRLSPGLLRIKPSGVIHFAPEDLADAGITDLVVLLVDRDRHLIGLRRPMQGDKEIRKVSTPKGRTSAVRLVSAREAFVGLGIDRKEVAGTYPLVVVDGLITIAMPQSTTIPIAGSNRLD